MLLPGERPVLNGRGGGVGGGGRGDGGVQSALGAPPSAPSTGRNRSRLHAALRLPWTRRTRPPLLEAPAPAPTHPPTHSFSTTFAASSMAAAIEDDPGGEGDDGRAKWGGSSLISSREAGARASLARAAEQRAFDSVGCQGNGERCCGPGVGGGDITGGRSGGSSGLGLPTRRVVPSSPPPSYEHVLAENRLAAERALAAAAAASAASAASSSASHCKGEAGTEAEEVVDGEKAAEAAGDAEAAASAPAAVTPRPVNTGPTEILHKSSKELYRAVAAQWGIACKMSDHCRCLDCQSRYFDCEYDQNQSDGGLGAGTPMFISEVMHGSACVIL